MMFLLSLVHWERRRGGYEARSSEPSTLDEGRAEDRQDLDGTIAYEFGTSEPSP